MRCSATQGSVSITDELWKLLVIDDDPWVRKYLAEVLESTGYQVDTAADGLEGLERLSHLEYDLVLSDVRMARMDGLEFLRRVRDDPDSPDVIMISGYATVDDAVASIKEGALDYITKPFEQDRVLNAVRLGLDRRRLEREVRSLRAQMLAAHGDARLVVVSPAMQRTMAVVEAVAQTDTMVLIEGSSGTGKEVIARSIHRQSQRAAGPFVPVDCGALPESLLESELFGYEKGAFTGATQTKVGLFESANGGTLLLDEIGELPLNLQATLLRVLQESEIRRVGGTRSHPIDVRIIAATNRDLEQMVEDGDFRKDLYYRLRVVPIRVPDLRDRPADIIPLATHFMDVLGRRLGKTFRGIDEDAARYLVRHEWRGNVRELENLIHGIIALYPPGSLSLSQIETLSTSGPTARSSEQPLQAGPASATLASGRGDAERTAILAALRENNGHQSRAADSLGISRTSLWRKMKKYQIDRR